MSSQCGYNKFYKRCMYKDCENGRFAHDKRIYKFPLQTDSRHKLWIRNSGNTNLEKWSPTTLRRSGLCEEHFTPNSFNPKSVNKGLKRDAVPIAFDSIVKEDNSKIPNRKRKDLNEQALYSKKNITEESVEKNINFMLNTIINDHDYIISYQELEELEEPPLKTYKPANLHFHSSVDEEDVIEWVHLEPPENHLEPPEKVSMAVLHKKENIQNLKTVNKGLKRDAVPIPFDSNVAQNNSKKLEENKKNITVKVNSSEIMINSLKEENILLKKENVILKKENTVMKRENSQLQLVIKGLKSHINNIITKSEMSEQNQKKKIIKN